MKRLKKIDLPFYFITLTPEEQDCFRHALFLDLSKDGLGEKISQVISNRNKSGVNGTQSFLAKLIQKISKK
jgi:hypothetical protein